jgi:hypothetical protein
MPSPYPLIEGAPLDQINQRFLDATVDVPQVPYGGIIEVGDLAVDLLDRGQLDWRTFGTTPLAGTRLRHAVAETVRQHGTAQVPNNEGLARNLPFAYELVVAGTVHAIDVLRRGDDSVQTSVIMPVSRTEVETSSEFLSDSGNRGLVRGMFEAVRLRLGRTDLPDDQNVVNELARYQPAIAVISQRYMGRSDTFARAEKQAELMGERERLMAVAGPAIHEALAPFATERPGVQAFAGALACSVPSRQLVNKHIAPLM